jgi:thiamine-phosphate pyrophosphorylase
MSEAFTAGADRALARAEVRARARAASLVDPDDLLAALADEPESRAGALLTEFGLGPARLLSEVLQVPPGPDDPGLDAIAPTGQPPASSALRALLADATFAAHAIERNRPVATEHLLLGLLSVRTPTVERMISAGLDRDGLMASFVEVGREEAAPLIIDGEVVGLDLAGPADVVDLARLLDAAGNRAREGLRVVEDYVRFALDDPMLTRRLKDVRHRLSEALGGLGLDDAIAARDTRGDVGTHISLPSESARESPRAVLAANFRRTTEALRSLEEFAKLRDPWLAGRFEGLRYDAYTLEKMTLTAATTHDRLGDARLYVLVGGQTTMGDLRWVVEEALAGGAQVIQLREKGLPDREVLARAREVRLLTIAAGARFIMNDRPDLARLASADGVHLGQDDLAVRDARRIVGTRALLGVSTHDPAQLERAVLDGAGYLGVGPVFATPTKDFEGLAGLSYVRQAAGAVTLPWFAIGGITEANVDEVLEAGATRVAVSAAVVQAPSPRRAAATLRARLDAAAGG